MSLQWKAASECTTDSCPTSQQERDSTQGAVLGHFIKRKRESNIAGLVVALTGGLHKSEVRPSSWSLLQWKQCNPLEIQRHYVNTRQIKHLFSFSFFVIALLRPPLLSCKHKGDQQSLVELSDRKRLMSWIMVKRSLHWITSSAHWEMKNQKSPISGCIYQMSWTS